MDIKTRLRRIRSTPAFRDLLSETQLTVNDFIAPIFVSEPGTKLFPIPSLPGVSRVPFEELATHVSGLMDLGLKSVLLFPVIGAHKKDLLGTESYNSNGLVQQSVKLLKSKFKPLIVMADVALDPFTTHGHDGIVDESGDVENDRTVEALCKMSVSLSEAGVDVLAPSDMMDGRVLAMRRTIDERGFTKTAILAYSAKYNSGFYGPFREAVGSGARGLDKGTYQLNPSQVREAIREVECDVNEGADMIMVKPALPYLDIIAKVRAACPVPIVAYQVSGEYAMLKAAAQNNWLDEKRTVIESLIAIKRAGADLIVSYYAPDVARWLNDK